MMKKIFLFLALILVLSGCSTLPDDTNKDVIVETQPSSEMDPFFLILQNHEFHIDQNKTTEVKITRETPSKLDVIIVEDGYMDDSIKGETYSMTLEKQDDDSWQVTNKELTDVECYRGEGEEGKCL